MDRKNIVGLMVLTGFLHAICGCSDSGTSATGPTAIGFTEDGFSCVVERYESRVKQTLIIDDSVSAVSGVTFNKAGQAAFFYDGEFSGVSTRDMESLCSRLQKEVDALGEDSVFCGEYSADYIVYIPRREAASLDEVLLKKTDECAEALDEWRRRYKK